MLAVVTLVRDRHEHLLVQQARLTGHRRVLVSMGDPEIASLVPGADVVAVPTGDRLPLAAARNAGAARAFARGAGAALFLDVDVIPGPALLDRYADALARRPDAVLSGPVAYLPPGVHEPDGTAPHPARPAPPPGVLEDCARPELFWSLSFAVTAATWARTGGFDEAYEGYGAEDTDFGLRCARAGVPLVWVGGAVGYHQHHPVSRPPVEHLDDILRNGRLFADRWGRWPMTGWLESFEDLGLVARDGDGWVRSAR